MLGYMNGEALQKPSKQRKVTFFSRTQQRLWDKRRNLGQFFKCGRNEL